MILTKFERKMFLIAKEEKITQYSDMPKLFCLAEFGEEDSELESRLEEFLKSGKEPVSKYVKTAAKSINRVHKYICMQYSEYIDDADTNIEFKKYTIVFNKIDGFIKTKPFYLFAFSHDLLKELPEIMKLTNFNQGEWDMKIYVCKSNSKVVQKYGYYHEIRNAECVFEYSYMSDVFKSFSCNPDKMTFKVNKESYLL